MPILQLDTLYKVKQVNTENFERKGIVIDITGGTASIYGSNGTNEIDGTPVAPTSLAEMSLNDENDSVQYIKGFNVLPRYIALTGTATKIIVTGMIVDDLGSIS